VLFGAFDLSKIPFWKVESVGNDFVLVHHSDVVERAAGDIEGYLRSLAISASERRFGVGSDGLLVLGPDDRNLILRMFNPDGTEDFCGNGLRCAAIHGTSQGWVGESFIIHHHGVDVPTRVCGEGCIETQLARASYKPEDIPAAFHDNPELTFRRNPLWSGLDLDASSLTTGSTHTIVWVDKLPEDEEFFHLGPRIENDSQFPERTSVIWVHEVAPMKLEIRIWERGAGETLGCGTGASAAAVDFLRRREIGGPVEVVSKGGAIQVAAPTWDAPLVVRGTAKELFRGEFVLP
jgi:diaminopimelate epimerase